MDGTQTEWKRKGYREKVEGVSLMCTVKMPVEGRDSITPTLLGLKK